jgi:hypothetical protein
MNDYTTPGRGQAGPFGKEDASDPKPPAQRNPAIKDPGRIWQRETREGRPLDPSGKLRIQTARPDLKQTGHVDLTRLPRFKKI